jgi:hypothetical protein
MVGSFRCIGRSGPARYRAAQRDAPGQFLERPLDEVEFHLDLAGAMELDFVGLFEALNRLTQGVEDDVALVEDVDNRVVFRACDVDATEAFEALRLRDRRVRPLQCFGHR